MRASTPISLRRVQVQRVLSPLSASFFTFARANSMTTEDIGREILRLMNRSPGVLQPSRVTLKDGSAFNGVPFSLETETQRSMVARFILDGETALRMVRLDEIDSIC